MNESPSYTGTLPQEQVQAIVERTERQALKTAASTGARVTEVRVLQHKKLDDLFRGHGEGAMAIEGYERDVLKRQPQAGKPPQPSKETKEQITRQIEAVSDVREKATARVKDAKVAETDGSTIAFQNDGSKEIFMGVSILDSRSLQERRGLLENATLHELEHRKQEDGDARFALPPTGNPVIDGQRQGLRRQFFREKRAMEAEGGIHAYTSQKYVERYWNVVEAVKQELKRRGRNGTELVNNAAQTQEGFRKLHREMMAAVMTRPNPAVNGGRRPEWKAEHGVRVVSGQ